MVLHWKNITSVVRYSFLILAVPNWSIAQIESSLADIEPTIRIDPTPLTERQLGYESRFRRCGSGDLVYAGSMQNGIPHGLGKVTARCPVVLEIGQQEIAEICNWCGYVVEWSGYFTQGTLRHGTVLMDDGTSYTGPFFDLLPHGLGTVHLTEDTSSLQRFRFGDRVSSW